MSALRLVAETVHARGHATTLEIHAELPSLSLFQVRKAIARACVCGYVRVRSPRGGEVANTVYESGVPLPPEIVRRHEQATGTPVCCVWELGSGPSMREWPPHGIGTRYAPLGGWNEETKGAAV